MRIRTFLKSLAMSAMLGGAVLTGSAAAQSGVLPPIPADSGVEADLNADVDAKIDANTNANTDANTNTNANTDVDADANANVDGALNGNGNADANTNADVQATTRASADRSRYRRSNGVWSYRTDNDGWVYYRNGRWMTQNGTPYRSGQVRGDADLNLGANGNSRYQRRNGDWYYRTDNDGWVVYRNGDWYYQNGRPYGSSNANLGADADLNIPGVGSLNLDADARSRYQRRNGDWYYRTDNDGWVQYRNGAWYDTNGDLYGNSNNTVGGAVRDTIRGAIRGENNGDGGGRILDGVRQGVQEGVRDTVNGIFNGR